MIRIFYDLYIQYVLYVYNSSDITSVQTDTLFQLLIDPYTSYAYVDNEAPCQDFPNCVRSIKYYTLIGIYEQLTLQLQFNFMNEFFFSQIWKKMYFV